MYDNRSVSFSASYSVNFGDPFNRRITVFNRTWNERVLSASNANSVKTAADNAYRIQESNDIRIDTQRIFDALPTEQILSKVKEDVDAGLAVVPIGYELAEEGDALVEAVREAAAMPTAETEHIARSSSMLLPARARPIICCLR